MKKKIAILGATGSVGSQALSVARVFKDKLDVVMLSAYSNTTKLCELANEFKPSYIAMEGLDDSAEIKNNISYDANIFVGNKSILNALSECDCDLVLLSVVGIAGLAVFEQCIKMGKTIALANKESLVCGGEIVLDLIKKHCAKIIPVDSEHSAIYECLNDSFDTTNVRNIIITASGGPFRGKKREELLNVTPQMAVKHPNWSMGQKISIDSATLANKGLEVIEAYYMFGMQPGNINVVVHPQSIVHSMIEYFDSSVIAQMGQTDMRLPIQKALLESKSEEFILNKPLDLTLIGSLTFEKPDLETFRCLKLAYECLKQKGNMPAVYNIANEGAVDLFIKEKISFLEISNVIEKCMDKFSDVKCTGIKEILELNNIVRDYITKSYRA